jgi:hypothetical protein
MLLDLVKDVENKRLKDQPSQGPVVVVLLADGEMY